MIRVFVVVVVVVFNGANDLLSGFAGFLCSPRALISLACSRSKLVNFNFNSTPVETTLLLDDQCDMPYRSARAHGVFPST